MKRLFFCLAVLGVILTGCSKNDDGESDKPNNNGNEQPENPNEPKLPELPALPDPDDVCSAMDDLKFMAYCYEKFDVNKDGKVSETEANAVRIISINYRYPVESLKGIERFPNIEIFRSGDRITELDLRYNLKLKSISGYSSLLTTVLLPNTLTSIEKSAFKERASLIEIHFPASLTSIGESAFSGCSSLTEINLPNNLTSIGVSSFYGCSSLTEIIFPDNLTSIGVSAFYGCSSLTEIIFPDNLTSIGESAFSGCSSLTEIIFSDNLTSIGRAAFEYCSNLTKVICHALVPPTINYISGSSTIENLYVPAESIQAYKDSLWARYFKNILPIE